MSDFLSYCFTNFDKSVLLFVLVFDFIFLLKFFTQMLNSLQLSFFNLDRVPLLQPGFSVEACLSGSPSNRLDTARGGGGREGASTFLFLRLVLGFGSTDLCKKFITFQDLSCTASPFCRVDQFS